MRIEEKGSIWTIIGGKVCLKAPCYKITMSMGIDLGIVECYYQFAGMDLRLPRGLELKVGVL